MNFLDKISQIVKETIIMMIDKAASKIQNLMFHADFGKSKEALLDHFSAMKMFSNNRHNCLSEGLVFFQAMGSTRSETK